MLRTVLALEGVAISARTLRRTRRLEVRRQAGDPRAPEDVALTRRGHLFGVPNSQIALLYFAVIGLLSVTGLGDRKLIRLLTLLAGWTSLAVSAYLLYSLLFVLKHRCRVCIETHLLNLALTSVLMLPTPATDPMRRRRGGSRRRQR